MPRTRNTDGLRRGGISADAQAKGREAIEKQRAEDKALQELSAEDPYAAYDEMHATMTKHILRLLRKEQREGGLPQREITDRLREYRQLTDSLAEYRRTRGEADQAKEFFTRLDERLQTANFNETSPTGPTK